MVGGSAPHTPRSQSASGLPIYALAPDVRAGGLRPVWGALFVRFLQEFYQNSDQINTKIDIFNILSRILDAGTYLDR